MSQPISLHPDNPHYFLYQGKPTILITSAEHYGAVINLDFDYIKYFDRLHKYTLNYTRIYPGALIEPARYWTDWSDDTLGPENLIVPWARSAQPGYVSGGNKFDLDRWDPEYFARLKNFIEEAGKRHIVVEICFFNSQYPTTWPLCPLYKANNIQGEGDCLYPEFQTLKYPNLVKRQEDYVRRIVEEVNPYDNVILEICDEPTNLGTEGSDAVPWISQIINVIIDTESEMPKKHIIAQQLETDVDFSADPRVPLIVAQYVLQTKGQVGGMKALDEEYRHNKPIELNETSYYPMWYDKADRIANTRVEAWEFFVGGGAGFNQLNALFTAKDPVGDTEENAVNLAGLARLKAFIEGFHFVHMLQDKSFVKGGVPAGAFCRAISEPGKQYAVYLHHSIYQDGGNPSIHDHEKYGHPLHDWISKMSYIVTPGRYQEELALELPAGSYRADWIEPATGLVIRTDHLDHQGGTRVVTTPAYSIDIALRIMAH